MERLVVLLCGPPGAGKTTIARQSGLDVYDSDDPQWRDGRDFNGALHRLGRERDARAVVIRAGASSSARRKASLLVNATRGYLVTEDPRVLTARVAARHRPGWRREVAGIGSWFARFDDADGIEVFPGWDGVMRIENGRDKYGYQHRQTRAEWKPIVEAGGVLCARCDKPIDPSAPWDLGHDDTGRQLYNGPEHTGCNRSAGGRNGAAVVHARERMTTYAW